MEAREEKSIHTINENANQKKSDWLTTVIRLYEKFLVVRGAVPNAIVDKQTSLCKVRENDVGRKTATSKMRFYLYAIK